MTRFTIHLFIETFDRSIGTDFVEKLKTGSVAQAPGGVDLEYMGAETRKSFDVVPDILQFIVTAARDVDINLFAAWLFTEVAAQI